MPNLYQTLRYGFRKYIQPWRVRIKHVLLRVIIFLLLALLLEVVVFNFRTIITLGNKPVDLSSKIALNQTDDGRFVISSNESTIELKDICLPLDNVYLNLCKDQDAQEFDVKFNFTDQGHSTYFDTTEYSVGVPSVKMSTVSKRSQYVSLHTTGDVKDLKIQIYGEEVNYPIYLKAISVNNVYPFNFVIWRYILSFLIIFLVYIFRPHSSVYKIIMIDRPIYTKIVISFTIAIEVILFSCYLFMGSNLVGIATSSYNYGEWDGQSPVNTFNVAGDNAQQYAELAKSFTEGKLYLNQDPPQYLKTMSDPYDKGSRDELQKQTGQPYLFDVGYYDGHYYVYFGVVPVLLFYLPFYVVTGQNFPTAVGVLIMVILFVVGVSVLLDRFSRGHFKRVSLGLYLLLQIPLIVCSGVLYLLKFPTFYSLPIACALAFAVWGLYFWLRAKSSNNPCLPFLIGSFCMALIVGCRPQIFLLAGVAIPLFWRKYITNAKISGVLTKNGLFEMFCFVIPFVIVGALIMWYNYARFGSVANFGANYNLTMNDMTLRGMQLARVMPAIFAYFLQPPNVCAVFPFLQPVTFATTYLGQTIKEVTFGGAITCLPVLWILFYSVPILRVRTRLHKTKTITGVIVVLIICALVIAVLDAQMAGILQRYFADFSFMLLLSACLLIFILNDSMFTWKNKYKKIVSNTLLVLVAISVIYSLLICFVVETGWYGDVYNWAYRDFLKTIMFWT